MTVEVDDPREFFVEIDASGLEDDEYTFHVADPRTDASAPDENGDINREEFKTITVDFDIPEGERRAAALAELYDYSVKAEEEPFPPERVYETDTLRFLADEKEVGYECVKGDKTGFVIIPPVEVVRVEK